METKYYFLHILTLFFSIKFYFEGAGKEDYQSTKLLIIIQCYVGIHSASGFVITDVSL